VSNNKTTTIMEENYLVFEVETYYLNGEVETELISAPSEKEMWDIYDEIHAGGDDLIGNHAIIGRWVQ
jgi:hypothetical protein